MLNESTIVHNVVQPDIGRAVAWTRYLSGEARAHMAETDFKPNRRPVLF